jgi:hypothetical protein
MADFWEELGHNATLALLVIVSCVLLGYCGKKLGLIGKLKDPEEERFFQWIDYYLRRFVDWFTNPEFKEYDLTPGFTAEKTFTTQTPAGFKVRYQFELICRRLDKEQSKRARMLDTGNREAFVAAYNQQILLPYFGERSCFFHIEWLKAVELNKQYEVFRTPVCQLLMSDAGQEIREFPDTQIMNDLGSTPLLMNGCDAVMGEFNRNIFDDELVEENYAMLTAEQREAVLRDPRYGPFEEMLAVSALKRRLEFIGKLTNQSHEGDWFSVQTERVGQTVRIAWKMKEQIPAGYELVGFEKNEGFYSNPYDEDRNGTMVIHSFQDGQRVVRMAEGESNFYTLYLRSENRKPDGTRKVHKALRFQITLASQGEFRQIADTLERAEKKKTTVDPDKEHISRAIKELGVFVELDAALETKTREWKKGIMESEEYSAEEKADKIERLRDVMAALRSKYEP